MITVEQAWTCIRDTMPRWETHRVPIHAAFGAVLAEAVHAERDQPPFDRVMMDGMAFAFRALASRREFTVQATVAAGAPSPALISAEHCIEIMTGAPLPPGCDTVVPVEQLERTGTQLTIADDAQVQCAQFVHRRGSDYARGATLLEPGTRLGAAQTAVLAASGLAEVQVAGAPAIAVIAVGDELVDPGKPIGAQQIRRSNDFAIAALLHMHGTATAHRMHLPDDPAVLERALGDALANHGVLILTGGVSMGKFDYVPAILKALGVEIVFHKVRQRPGKPMWFGRCGHSVVFALPGNPVSALVCARRYVIPAIAHAMGAHAKTESVRLAEAVEPSPTLTWLAPVVLTAAGEAQIRATNTSGDFYTLAATDGFVELPADSSPYPPGTLVALWRW